MLVHLFLQTVVSCNFPSFITAVFFSTLMDIHVKLHKEVESKGFNWILDQFPSCQLLKDSAP